LEGKNQTLINGKLSSIERRLEGKNSCGTDGWMIAFGKDD